MKEQNKKTNPKPLKKVPKKASSPISQPSAWIWLASVLAITFVLFLPALQNGFTNWDDVLYVTSNPLLKSLDADGLKAIFTTPVVSNYHPLTILSLAINYQFAELSPMSYHLTSVMLHVINTGLVFWFIWLLSSGNRWVSAIVALLFGIHPMHVESVAWISERKDLLYTLFYVGAMIAYVKYVQFRQNKYLILATVLGAISLLCKPAAIALPLSLLAIDYYLKREWNWSWVVEKIPMFIMSGIIAYVTLAIQVKKAVASVELYGVLDRICFAGYGVIWYLVKLVVPYPLSALHPFPMELNAYYYLATAASIAGVAFLLWKVHNRNYLFGFSFYLINLILVLQLISIGNAVVAERYTYVPYIGIFFMLAMEVTGALKGSLSKYKWIIIGIAGAWIAALAYLTWTRIPVWNNSQALWENVLEQYPESPRAWTNKGLDLYDQQQWPEVIAHLSKALETDPNYADALEWRSRAYFENKEKEKALADAEKLIKLFPQKEAALFVLARAQDANGQSESAIALYNQLILRFPDKAEYINNRGVIYFNKMKRYEAAKADFEQAIRINPTSGSYYLNLSRCYYMLNDVSSAQKFAVKALELGTEIDPSFRQLIGIQ
ncbi:MAG TPA: tetratricopeptide repeat protein [Saprospiraceae bacterium]|nr:tetratricopeptide repeat protein [Saprospiraceae bacterium]